MSSDDDSELSTSSREYLESPAKAKREALRRKFEKAGFGNDAKKGDAALKSLKLSVLKSEVTKKDNQPSPANAPASFGTKTREQEIAAARLSGETKPTTDTILQQATMQQKAEEQLKQDEVQSEEA